VSLEQSRIEDATGTNSFTLIGLPTTLERNTTNDLLNPTKGGKLSLSATPYTGAIGSDSNFLILRLDDTMHLPFDAAGKYVLAGRIAIGAILGATRTDIPADKRFYAGGGDTVRGYAHQSVGPLDASNDPVGGSSLIAGSIEMRARVMEDIGVVAFLDGGNVFRSELPDFGKDPLFGAGLGLRYYTPIGPLRFDLAFPLDKRPSDDAFQIYISLGQAF
jgi:translocation and assembly module TamA